MIRPSYVTDVVARATAAQEALTTVTSVILQHGSIDQADKAFVPSESTLALCETTTETAQSIPQIPCPALAYEHFLIVVVGPVPARNIHLRAAKRMKAVLQVSMQIACGSWDLEDVDSLSLDRFQAPSPATLTRGRYKLDIFHMLLRQDHWKRTQFENSFVSLCNLLALGGVILLAFLVGYDGTLQAKELFIVEEYSTRVADAVQNLEEEMLERGRQCRDLNPADALESDDVDDGTGVGPVLWKRDPLRMDVRLLPLMSLGKGYTSYHNKLDCLAYVIMLETAYTDRQEALQRYADRVVCNLSDQGTESKLVDAAAVDLTAICVDVSEVLEWDDLIMAQALLLTPNPETVNLVLLAQAQPAEALLRLENTAGDAHAAAAQGTVLSLQDHCAEAEPMQPLVTVDDDEGCLLREEGPGLCLRDHGQEPTQPGPATATGDEQLQEAQADAGIQEAPANVGLPSEAERLEKLFPNSIKVSGFKHIADNLLGSVLTKLPWWANLLPKLTAFDRLLGDVTWRDRLKGLRWEAVSNFCRAVLPLQRILRSAWDGDKYLKGTVFKDGKKKPFLVEESSKATLVKINSLMKSNKDNHNHSHDDDDDDDSNDDDDNNNIKFDPDWACIALVATVAEEADFLGKWAESCGCCVHRYNLEPGAAPESLTLALPQRRTNGKKKRRQPQQVLPPCPLKGCRAAEMAAGIGMQCQSELMRIHNYSFMEHIQACDPSDRLELQSSWTSSRAILWGELTTKMQHWKELPWLLCGLSYSEPRIVRDVAVRALRQYDGAPNASGSLHAQSRRFLDPAWKGLRNQDDDPALRPLMELLAGGVSVLDLMQKTPDQLQEQGGWIISDACLASFRNWLAGLRQVPCSQTQADALQSLPSSVLGSIVREISRRMRKRTETEQAAEARNDDLEEKAALALADSQKKTAPSAGAFTQGPKPFNFQQILALSL
ncbi:unnamed protein product [Symbiodinium microadriaticum]|nr:unnamed protein product [Symbiodinium sp. KB8]CAE7250232.1 unnamed protein product [Symbiodinium microadriaticum]